MILFEYRFSDLTIIKYYTYGSMNKIMYVSQMSLDLPDFFFFFFLILFLPVRQVEDLPST